jgi:hypothetical protein
VISELVEVGLEWILAFLAWLLTPREVLLKAVVLLVLLWVLNWFAGLLMSLVNQVLQFFRPTMAPGPPAPTPAFPAPSGLDRLFTCVINLAMLGIVLLVLGVLVWVLWGTVVSPWLNTL